MQSLDLNLCVFTSSKGHFGRVDIYKQTFNDLFNKIPYQLFSNRYVHIKRSSGQDDVFNEQVNFFKQFKFEILDTYGDWSHFGNHQVEYSKDIIKMYDYVNHNSQYSLHLEDDWIFNCYSGLQLHDYFGKCFRYLSLRKDILCVRFPRFIDEPNRLNGLMAKHGMNVQCVNDNTEKSFFIHNDNLSLNPVIFRTLQIRAAARLMELNPTLQQHVEHQFSKALNWMSKEKYFYSIIDPKEIFISHIGTKLGESDPIGTPVFAN